MAPSDVQRATSGAVWELAARQHGVVARSQLLALLGLSHEVIRHRIARGRLHTVRRGIYAVGRPELTPDGRRMAAVLACGPGALLSHMSAAAVWGIAREGRRLHLTVPASSRPRPRDITLHRRDLTPSEASVHRSLPLTQPLLTLVDLAAVFSQRQLEAAVNAADRLNLIRAGELPSLLRASPRRPGLAALKKLVAPQTFRLTDSELERDFLRLVRRAKLPLPEPGAVLDGRRVDFYWPRFEVVAETDGLTYHRTPAQQTRDRERDQLHFAAGRTPLRFTHHQIRHEPSRVAEILGRALAGS